MYDSLRSTYNSFRPSGSLPVPPLEEWHGVDVFCDDCYCRCVDCAAVANRRRMVNATVGKTGRGTGRGTATERCFGEEYVPPALGV